MASDNFNRADSASLGSPWVDNAAQSGCRITSNTARGGGGGSFTSAYYGGAASSADQFSEATIAVLANGDNAVAVRHHTSNDQYYMVYNQGSGGINIFLRNGSYTNLGSVGGTIAVGDVIRAEISGSTITAKQNGVTLGSKSDGTLTTGQPGIVTFNNNAGWDDWSGGDLGGAGGGAAVRVSTLTLMGVQ